ncbi:MAG: TonB-dependent receptor [Tannerellaceae bacterium]|jgi:TonB-linked SusC/RagA family outer membrane protein|nr:TonB-dependent receptor [Tannerellaceae bacterium]
MKKIVYLLFCLFLGIGLASAQTTLVSGVVTSADDGEPIIGASVLVKGTTVGTITDLDGAFSLNAPTDARTLTVSFVGYLSQDVAIGRNMNIVLQTSAQNLDEIVVVGYGTQRKKDVTSSISQVRGQDISDKAAPSFLQQMAGRASGVQIISSSADLSAPPRVIIRGVGTISSSTSPLYVVNGVPIASGNLSEAAGNEGQTSAASNNALADINPADIESFEILKDGAATAIYGSRAANGVILITTKQGKQGAAKLTYDTWMGVSSPSKLYDLLNAQQFVEIANEKDRNAGNTEQAAYDGTNTNWYDHVFRTGVQHSHSISLSGASPKTQYYMSASYSNQKGVSVANSYDRYTFYGRANHNFLNDKVSAGFSLNASQQKNTGATAGTNSLSGTMYASMKMLPNVPVYNADDPTGYNISPDRKGLGAGPNNKPIDLTIPNIMWVLNNNKIYNTSWRLLPTANLDIKPVDFLTYRALVGADVSLVDAATVWRPESGDGLSSEGYISRTLRQRHRWNFQNILTFNKDFGVHHVDATAVAEYTQYEYKSYSAYGENFSDPFFVDELISNTYSTYESGGAYTTNGLASYIFRANYNYNSLAYIGGSVRRDGISVLHPDNRWGTFYGASAALRISNLDFWKESPINNIINDLRIRGSLAEVGNDRLSGDFLYKDIFGGQMYGTQTSIAYRQSGNKDLKWETQKISDIGFDMGFFNSRYNLVFAYWSKNNSDIVLEVPTPPSLGVPRNKVAQNYGSIKNNGIELEIGGNIIQQKDLIWKSSLNFSTQKSKVVTLVDDIVYEHYILREGESVNALYGYRYAGVNKANGNPMYYRADNSIVQGNIANSQYYLYDPANPNDMTPDNIANLTTDDKAILGNTLPTWFGGWDNTLTWKQFDLNIFLRFSGGNNVANVTRRDLLNQNFLNNSTEILGRWQSPENPGDGQTPKLWYNRASFINLDANGLSRWVEDGDFLKLQNLAVGYTLPSSVCRLLYIERARVYLQGQNLLTFTSYSGLDPEAYNAGQVSGVAGVPGIDWNSNPQQRTFMVGLNITF